MNDLIIELTKRDTPTDSNEYVCLGHYDLARIKEVSKGKRWPSFRYFKSPVKGTYSAPESIQRNYLISSGVEYGKGPKESAFTFLMTISVNHNDPDKHTLQDYVAAFLERLKVNEEKTEPREDILKQRAGQKAHTHRRGNRRLEEKNDNSESQRVILGEELQRRYVM